MKTSKLDLVEKTQSGFIQFRIALTEGDSVKWHRSAIEPGGDVDAQMSAVNANLVDMGWPAVTDYKTLKDAQG